jgi:hypothetical protein
LRLIEQVRKRSLGATVYARNNVKYQNATVSGDSENIRKNVKVFAVIAVIRKRIIDDY